MRSGLSSVLSALRASRRAAYAWGRIAGDLNAVARGPRAAMRRVVRKALYRAASREINRIVPP